MAFGQRRYRAEILGALSSIFAAGCAAPTIAFPFNSQVPTVARVNQPYLFQFSDSTFAPQATNFTYSLSEQPAWLSIDSATRTLSGMPSVSDAGASTFTLTAADDAGAAYMPCTLVVSANPPPRLQGNIGEQLAETANLSSSDPPVATLLPSDQFHFSFQQDSFIDIVQRTLYYYATLTDHTPLPSWLSFDPQNLAFSGTAPILSAFPQSWDINLVASDVAGFAGATATFTIAVGTQQLVFIPSQQSVNVSSGMNLDFTALQSQLFRNGAPVSPASLAKAQTSGLPSWLEFDPSTLALTGAIPSGSDNESIAVTVMDVLGDSATATINLVSGSTSLFSGTIGSLTAYSGQPFNYTFPEALFSESDVNLRITLPTTVRWLQFDSPTHRLWGTVPAQTTPTTIAAQLMAKSASHPEGQTQPFTISVEADIGDTPSSSGSTAIASPTNSESSTTQSPPAAQRMHSRLSRGVIAAIIILSLVAAMSLMACLVLCVRRKRREGYERHSASPVKKETISRPIVQPDPAHAITVTTDLHRDVEKTAGSEQSMQPRAVEPAPQIALDLPPRSHEERSPWLKRLSRVSQVSSIGHGEAAIRSDMNIPEWGRESAALHTPHESFSVPTEMARMSRQLSQTSPTKRALQRLRERHKSRQSVGLGIDTGGASLMPRHSARQSRNHGRRASNLGLSAAMDRSSQASFSTKGTSVLSTRPLEATQSTSAMSRLIPTLSITEADKRKSIRLVGRSDSIEDERPMAEKRQSFIRNRASTSLQSPLFSHGSRASSNTRQHSHGSAAASSAGSARRSHRGKSVLTTYSESSSLEPQGQDSRRLSARLRSTFSPDLPRAVTRSSMGADDEGDSSSGFCTTASPISEDEDELAKEAALPRHQRAWVRPGEASPTPPPVPPTSRQASSARHSTPPAEKDVAKPNRKGRLVDRSSTSLSTAVDSPTSKRNSTSGQKRDSQARRSRLSEPISLVSNDSVSKAKMERPRMVHTNSGRPVSVEDVERLSSLKAKIASASEMDTEAGSERWDDAEGSGLMPKATGGSKVNTQRSDMSGPAFL